jgi:hypothetical protein
MIHRSAFLVAALVAIAAFFEPVFASENPPGTAPVRHASPGFKVPSKLTARMPIDQDVKDFLDRDFRSRYPVASPFKIDVAQADVQMYTVSNVLNGYGGFDRRHSFRVVVYHADRSMVTVEITVYQRSTHEPDQDPLLLEWFRIVGVVR